MSSVVKFQNENRNICISDINTGEIINKYNNVSSIKISKDNENDNIKNILNFKNRENEFSVFIDKNMGSFYFQNYINLINANIEPAMLFRFIYLCTYADYDKCLRYGLLNKYMEDADFYDVFRIARATIHETRKYLYEKQLITKVDNKIYINSNYYIRGKIDKVSLKESAKIFDNSIRNLYSVATSREHKLLGQIINIMPFTNNEFNIICSNPDEKDINLIKPLNIKQIGKLLNSSENNESRIIKKLTNITIGGEPIIAGWNNKYTNMYIVNPNIYYKGTNIDNLYVICQFFKLKNKDTTITNTNDIFSYINTGIYDS